MPVRRLRTYLRPPTPSGSMTSVSSDAGPSLSSRSSGSASPVETSDSNDYIEEFFRYRPDTLHKAKNHTTSPNTRPPAFFDRHLDPQLRLRHVAYLPSITTDLMAIADEAVKAADSKGTLPRDRADFPTPDVRASQFEVTRPDGGFVVSEENVKLIYAGTTAKFCCSVAANLEFQLGEWKSTLFEYTLTTDQKCGIADGFLTIARGALGRKAPVLPEKYTLVADTFPSLAVWEFKSLKSGEPSVMEAIVRQAIGDMAFDWEGCEHGKKCVALHAGKDGLPPVTGNRMGRDAEPPACPSVNDVDPRVPTGPFSSLSKGDRKSAGYITQQSWSEAVQEDATFIIIHAGNLEIICIRHRKSQTLFVSDVVKVDNCDYGRLHTGLYIAILRDAVDRALQLKLPNIPTTWTKVYGEHVVSKMTDKETFNQACLRDWLVLLPSSKKPSLVGFRLDTFYFRKEPSKELKHNTEADLRACFKIILKEEIALFVAKGTLEVNGKRIKNSLTGSVVVKVAHTEDAIEKLNAEHKIYLDLSRAGVLELPRIVGFFNYVDIEGSNSRPLPCAVLVMENVGSPVCHFSEGILQQHLFLFQNLLKKIHRAGIIHNNLSRENLMILGKDPAKPAKVSIISFGSARKVDQGQQALFDDEYATLLRLLPSPSKRPLDGGHTKSYNAAFPAAQVRAPSGG